MEDLLNIQNAVWAEQLGDGRIAYHVEHPAITVFLPEGSDVYEPTADKATADIVRLLADNYTDWFPGRSVVEIGSGDHALIAHATKALGATNVTATDVDPKAISLLNTYGSPDITYRRSDLFSDLDGEFDMIVFNPPQMPMPAEERARLTDWHDSPGDRGYEVILETLNKAGKYLTHDGRLVMMVFDFLMTDGVIAKAVQDQGFAMRPVGKIVKQVRPGGKTEQSLHYIRTIFPGLDVHEDDVHGRYIYVTLLEFTKE